MKEPIGIIGGMGPAASQLFYRMVTEHTRASSDQDHLDMIILNDASMPDRTSAILGGDYDPPREELLSDARLLQNAGCSAIAVICNTAHFFVDMIRDEIDIPILHMIELTVEEISGGTADRDISEGPIKVGIMATDGTIRTRLYERELEKRGIVTYHPGMDIQREVMHQIYDRIKAGKRCDRKSFARIDEDFREAGCSYVILGCTELSVIKKQEKLPDFYVDPMLILARKVIEFSGRTFIS